MGIEIMKTIIIIATVVFAMQFVRTNATGEIFFEPGRRMPAVIGDPGPIEALSAIISMAGGSDSRSRYNKDGKWPFEKAVGPFEEIDIKIDASASPHRIFPSHLTGNSVVTQAVSVVRRHEPSFDSAVRRIKDVTSSIAREARIHDLNDAVLTGKSYVVRNVKPAFGGWRIMIGVQQVDIGEFEYRLLLQRNLNVDRQATEVRVEVDI